MSSSLGEPYELAQKVVPHSETHQHKRTFVEAICNPESRAAEAGTGVLPAYYRFGELLVYLA